MVKEIGLWVAAVALVAAGLAGVVFPVLPGAPLVYAGLIVAAWAENFQYVGWPTLMLLGVLTAFTYVVDLVASALGAKRVGASRFAVWGAVLGGMVGVFFGVIGIMLGPFIGAVVGELGAGRSMSQAGKVGVATWVGFIVGTIGKLALLFTMIGIFVVARLV